MHIAHRAVSCKGVNLSVHDAKHLAQVVFVKQLEPDNDFGQWKKMRVNDKSWIEIGMAWGKEGGGGECKVQTCSVS